MCNGPIDFHTGAAPGAGGAALPGAAAAARFVFRGVLLIALAALMIALANDLAAADGGRARRILAAVSGPARMATLVRPNRGRAATGTATVATTSLLRFGSRWPR